MTKTWTGLEINQMYYWQVRKYPPLLESEKDKPKISTWTSIINIGKIYEDGPLTMSEYLRVEDKYVAAVLAYMNVLQVKDLEVYVINKLREELFLDNINLYPDCYPPSIIEFYYSLNDGDILTGNHIDYIVRLGMREDIVCQLRNNDKFFVNFAYDFYMDIGSAIICEEAINEIKKIGLFIDLWKWPYPDNVWEKSEDL